MDLEFVSQCGLCGLVKSENFLGAIVSHRASKGGLGLASSQDCGILSQNWVLGCIQTLFPWR